VIENLQMHFIFEVWILNFEFRFLAQEQKAAYGLDNGHWPDLAK
jgi:hypothetical protein